MAAKLLSMTNEYQNLVKAEKLLRSNSQEGNMLIEDKLSMAEILAPRPEPESRLKAIRLLEEVDKVQPLNEQASIQLGELYYAVGNWQKYTSQMEKSIGRYKTSVEPRQAYVRRLLAKGDSRSLDKAVDLINKLRELAPNNPTTFELTVRLAAKKGKQDQVRNDLVKRIPKMPEGKDFDAATVQQFAAFAGLLIELGDLDTAEKIYRDLAAKNPAANFDLARFLGEHRDADQCFAKLKEIYTPGTVQEVLAVALAVARERRDKIGDKYDAQIQDWLTAALRENPDSIPLLIVQGDLYDLEKKYDDAAGVYHKLLTRNDLTGLRRAVVLNNLSFLLALSGSSPAGDDPLKLVQEAEAIMGPNSDILDTRAVVLTSQKNYKQAIEALDLAVTDNPTASKYYHKARAHYLANEMRNAVEAWEKAEGLGLNRDSLNRMEFDQYEEMKTKIDQLRKRSVTQAEPARKAG